MLSISELLGEVRDQRPLFSFEFFPPKNPEGEKKLYDTIGNLKSLKPDFVSVTYGAGGSTRAKTLEWVTEIQNQYGITSMAHFTCVGSSKTEIHQELELFYKSGVRNIMALRGDPPKGEDKFVPPADGFSHASDLIGFIREKKLDFSIGGAAYPEVHLEATSAEEDLGHLKTKVDAGTDFLVTQLFFDNRVYFDFVNQCRAKGIQVPIIPGIMPITHFKQVEKFTAMTGCSIPEELSARILECKDDEERLLEVSLDFTGQQVLDLIQGGAPGIHFYTLNQSRATMDVLNRIQDKL